MTSFLEQIQHVVNGEPVDASATSRPTQQLENNLRNLRDLIELSLLGQALVAHSLAIDPTLSVGQVVYWNAEHARCEAALASTVFDQTLETLVGTPQSQVLGVVYTKTGTTTAEIVLTGWIKLDITNALNGAALVPGRYYLSGNTPGTLVLGRPSLSVPVLYATGDGNVLIFPQWREWAEDHEHFRVQMYCNPAGDHTPPVPGHRHTITNADASIPGWLPAHHASFHGHAPPNAAFGYNLAAHPELNRLWPPFPPEAATIIWDKGVDDTGGTEVPAGHNGLVIIDRYGIWWLSDCYADVPWPADFSFDDGHPSESISASLSEVECPRALEMLMTIYFNRVLYDASRTMVTSLRAAPHSILSVYGCDGEPASTGDLIVDADLALAIDQTDAAGHLVLKSITNNKFQQGPVVEGLIATSDNLLISSTAQKTVDGDTVHQGIISIGIASDPIDRELAPIVTRLADTKERYQGGIAYIGFPAGMQASVLQSFNVPPAGIAAGSKIELRLTMLGTAVGTLPTPTVTYRKIPRGTGTPQTLPSSDTALTVPSMPSIPVSSKYVEIVLPQFAITAGDTVQIVITRGAGDGYSGEVGILRTAAVLIAPAE